MRFITAALVTLLCAIASLGMFWCRDSSCRPQYGQWWTGGVFTNVCLVGLMYSALSQHVEQGRPDMQLTGFEVDRFRVDGEWAPPEWPFPYQASHDWVLVEEQHVFVRNSDGMYVFTKDAPLDEVWHNRREQAREELMTLGFDVAAHPQGEGYLALRAFSRHCLDKAVSDLNNPCCSTPAYLHPCRAGAVERLAAQIGMFGESDTAGCQENGLGSAEEWDDNWRCAAWHVVQINEVSGLYFLIAVDWNNLLLPVRYVFFKWNGWTDSPVVQARFDELPNLNAAWSVIRLENEPEACNNLAVHLWRHEADRLEYDEDRIRQLLEKAKSAGVATAEHNLNILKAWQGRRNPIE